MTSIDTSILDHIVHLTPPGSLDEVTHQFRKLGFKVLPGGVHAGGLTENALVVFEDGVYLELISFTHPRSHYPAESPEGRQRDKNPWSAKPPGWIDFAFLGNGSHGHSVSQTINERARKDGRSGGDLYEPEQDGGRTRPDGEVLKWLISGPIGARRGTLPFFCGDVTPRPLRVPSNPPSNAEHPSTTRGIAYVRVLVQPSALDDTVKEVTAVIGKSPVSSDARQVVWELNSPNKNPSSPPPRLILSTASTVDEQDFLVQSSGIYEVGFRVRTVADGSPIATPYGRIAWEKE
ncbi:hypothetical protein D9619_012220 [Psilocybe cf. subviscida]|uniref:Glyoxalase-like domain-containing protein n=1 Tax=Psilocybe cf. subviscida TaxID=2480587 RepID=A0A8H5B7I6_9AGAR|nr:hypothetical protein D9619_012220 [Psilocybe cf. subviscida]